MSRSFDFDLAVIGGGSAGYAAARTAANEGLKVVVIEGGHEVGGLCILRGCMPTKALLYAAEIMHLIGKAGTWGIHAQKHGFDFREVMSRKNMLIKEFADFRQEQLNSGKFEFLRGHAHFINAHTIELNSIPRATGGANSPSRRVSAKNFLIATGSTIAPSPLPALKTLDYLDSDSALKLERLPKSLIVLGGGAVAVEFAQFFARFGTQVTLIQRSPYVLHEFDSDATGELEKVFRREGITVYTKTKLLDARRAGDHKEVSFKHDDQTINVQAEEVLFALGRMPNIAQLGLEKLGIELQYTRIATNGYMQTSLPHIYAAGDCTGLHEIVHIAVQQGETAAYNITHPGTMRQMDYRLLTEVIFTEPQIATVGLTEKRAHVANIPYLAASYCFKDHGKSMIMDAMDGFVKLLADPFTGEIIGGCCVGPLAGDLIHEIVVAMHARMTAQQFACLPHYHPTLAEIWSYPAEELAEQINKSEHPPIHPIKTAPV